MVLWQNITLKNPGKELLACNRDDCLVQAEVRGKVGVNVYARVVAGNSAMMIR
jgi:hypothetical protein